MKLYAADAVFMPQHSSPAVGRLLRKGSDAQWRFARYVFSTTNPTAPRSRPC